MPNITVYLDLSLNRIFEDILFDEKIKNPSITKSDVVYNLLVKALKYRKLFDNIDEIVVKEILNHEKTPRELKLPEEEKEEKSGYGIPEGEF